MKYLLGLAGLAALASAAPAEMPTRTIEEQLLERNPAAAASGAAVTLTAGTNPFASRTLHANSVYASEIAAAMANVTDATIKTQASAVAKVGSFLWL